MTNSNISFETVKRAVCELVDEIEKLYAKELTVERVKDLPEIYMAFIYLENCGAQVVVSKPEWAPYRYVYFEVISILDKTTQIVYTWCDCDKDDIDSIVKNLQKGVKYAINYVPKSNDMPV